METTYLPALTRYAVPDAGPVAGIGTGAEADPFADLILSLEASFLCTVAGVVVCAACQSRLDWLSEILTRFCRAPGVAAGKGSSLVGLVVERTTSLGVSRLSRRHALSEPELNGGG